jgi:eukaryotic-like serine/threonine-protein kinase
MPLSVGDKLGPYEILGPLGAGGMGEVYRARDTRLGRDVALKILPADVAGDPSRRQRFELEARAVAALNHPNIVAIYDVAFEDRAAFIVSELVQGETLRGVIERGPVPVRRALDVAVQIADGLAAAHAANIAHRDLKPENLMLTADGRVKILDFGLAKPISRAAAPPDATQTMALTDPGSIVGTTSYMSPEQASGNADLDGRSDQFSLGLIVHEMITAKRAFQKPTAAETLVAIIREDPAPLPESLPGPLRWSLERCLSKDPAQRYEATRDLFLELRQWRDHASEITTASSAGPAHFGAQGSKPRRTSLFLLGAIAAGLIAGIALALVWLEAPLAPARYIPFATEPGIQTLPAWSPTGDRIAYSSEVDGVFQILVRKIGSSTPSQITRQDASCFLPFWSPDGTRIYYTVDRQGLDRSLWSTGVAGGDAEKVLDGVPEAAIAPDGKTLVVAAHQPDNTYALMLSSPPGAPPRPFPQASISQLREAFEWQFVFQFTKDGKYLGLLTDVRAKSEFWKIPMDGGAPEVLVQGRDMGEFSTGFNWLPDGSIVWSSNSSGGDGHLTRRDLRSGEDREITSGVSQERHHTLSPDGRTLAFQTGETGYDLIEVPLDGTPPASVLATDRNEVAPGWAPDGVHFVYATNRDGGNEIWLRNRRDGSERMIVSAHDFPDGKSDGFLDCEISPDGSRVAYRRFAGAKVEIWISSLAGDTPARLYNDPRNVFQRGASWSPDGNWIAYYSTYNGKPAVLKIRVGANHEPELVGYAADLNPVRWSPRGDWIAWNDGHKLVLASPDGKQNRIVSQKQWLTYGWSLDGTSLYGIGVTENRRLVLGRVEIASAREQVAADLGPLPAALDLADLQGDFPYRGFSMSPDGKSFLTSVLSIKGDIWLLEDFDRRTSLIDRLLRRK